MGRTHFDGGALQSRLDLSLGEARELYENLLQLRGNMSVCERRSPQDGWDTDEHLPVVDGVGVVEDVNESRDGRVLHVEGETGVAILELLDCLGLSVVGLALEGMVRTRTEICKF